MEFNLRNASSSVATKNSLTQLSTAEPSINNIEINDWKNVKIVVELLEPFKLATDEICGDDYVVACIQYL